MIKALRKRRERKEGIRGLGEGRDKEKERISSSQIKKEERVQEWKKVIGYGIRKHEGKNKIYFYTPDFLYICTNLPWSLVSPTLCRLGLLGTSSQSAVHSFLLESADSE